MKNEIQNPAGGQRGFGLLALAQAERSDLILFGWSSQFPRADPNSWMKAWQPSGTTHRKIRRSLIASLSTMGGLGLTGMQIITASVSVPAPRTEPFASFKIENWTPHIFAQTSQETTD